MTLEGCLETLDRAIEAADVLGIPTDQARAVRASAARRLGFPANVYVLALVGGTGVGKSSLLNALAGTSVSAASAHRPTTAEPVAWIPAESSEPLDALLSWMEVREVRTHTGPQMSDVAILDLPDIDSIEPSHRKRAEALLPKVDAVAWVTDPEKYHDAVLHDQYLRRWLPRLDRQVLVINKTDRLASADMGPLRGDLAADVARWLPGDTTVPRPRVVMTSALPPADGSIGGTAEFREWLGSEVDAKRVVRSRLEASTADAVTALAQAAGVGRTAASEGRGAPRAKPGPATPAFVAPAARVRAAEAAGGELLRLLDLPGVEQQMARAVRSRARTRGGGPFGVARGVIESAVGRPGQVADPVSYLSRWRERGSVVPAAEAMRRAVTDALPEAPAATRPMLAEAANSTTVSEAMVRLVDDVVSRQVDRDFLPSSRVWLFIGLLQTAATAALVAGIVWTAIWVLARPPVDTVQVPALGAIPIPLALIAIGAVAGYLLARVLGGHAGVLARRASRALAADLRAAVQGSVASAAFAALDRLEAARHALAEAATAVQTECAQDAARRP